MAEGCIAAVGKIIGCLNKERDVEVCLLFAITEDQCLYKQRFSSHQLPFSFSESIFRKSEGEIDHFLELKTCCFYFGERQVSVGSAELSA